MMHSVTLQKADDIDISRYAGGSVECFRIGIILKYLIS